VARFFVLWSMLAELERQVNALRREQVARFGWTHVDVTLEAHEASRVLAVSGTVVVPRVGRALQAALQDALPKDWSVDVSRVVALRTGDHRSLLTRVTPLWQRPKGPLATELGLDDGPVEVLAHANDLHLVRALDGTLGWMERALGARVEPPKLEAPRPRWVALGPAFMEFLGTPYRLGGTLREGVDCSGLLQRVYRSSQRILLPRHSTDQLDMTSRTRPSQPTSDTRETGDLVFTWTEREGPCHVGALVVGEEPVVLHASLSRRAVVRDPLARFVEGARRVEWVPRAAIEELGRQNAGRPGLELSGIE
jgi:hypothetical protein